MIEAEVTNAGVRAVDASKTVIEVVADGWTTADRGPRVRRPTDATVSGRTATLRFPPVFVTAERLDADERYELGGDNGPVELPVGEYVVRVDGNIQTYARFSGPATVSKPEYEAVVLDFPEETTLTLGFKSRVHSPPETLTVPATPEGVATALSQFPASHHTSTPDRSFPTMRGHPPLVEFGGEVDIPESVAERRRETAVELRVPPDLRYLFTGASLAHYLGATVAVEAGTTPTVATPTVERELEELPRFQTAAASLLRRTFLLDCLVRNAGPNGTPVAEQPLLARLGVDADALYDAPIADRLAAYLDAPFDRVSAELPEWHLSMYVEPTFEHVRTLPYLLYNVPNVFLPSSQPLDGDEWLSRSLDDFYRGGDDGARSVDLVKPDLGPGRTHGWLADGVPIDVFKTVPEAYENRAHYRERASDPISVVAILNDSGMEGEHEDAARIYRRRATELDIDITVREHLTTAELAEVFETPTDFVHYVGHCEEEGLRCADGHLPASSLAESRAQTFFLNACGSFHEGVELVRQGSVAGAVTFNKVLDSHAARVGTMFAQLLVHGFCIERALDMARRRVMMGKDYAVVGDGTHVLAQSDNIISPDVRLERYGDDEFLLRYGTHSPWVTGATYHLHLESDAEPHIQGSELAFELDRDRLREFLRHSAMPVVFDGDIHWSDELCDRL